ncbi:hypothetical protein L2U69_18520 [Zavarzinia compransoris]|uniref:hypothetical protein n=1 Tax=Zavarzinia marina TaxID=2911065 RepID=UPI001F3F7174|nr:hypothetical protein [Zavarzinia marina]MCF4167646.1 hypothetical protein [Zavarzinia marina]
MAEKIEIELDKARDTGVCPCCGHTSRVVSGFVYADGDAYAMYNVHWTVGHVAEYGANFDLVLGEFGEGATNEDQFLVALDYRLFETGPGFIVIDADTRPFAKNDDVRPGFSRDDVIGTSVAGYAFMMADAILALDPRIEEILGGWRVTLVDGGAYSEFRPR